MLCLYAQTILNVHVYHEVTSYRASKEHVIKICVLRHRVHDLQFCWHVSFLFSIYKPHTDNKLGIDFLNVVLGPLVLTYLSTSKIHRNFIFKIFGL